MKLDKGYWRLYQNSTKIYQCFNKNACLGGYREPGNVTESEEYFPVICEDGYSSYLCSVCTEVNGLKYERVSDNGCSKCIKLSINII